MVFSRHRGDSHRGDKRHGDVLEGVVGGFGRWREVEDRQGACEEEHDWFITLH